MHNGQGINHESYKLLNNHTGERIKYWNLVLLISFKDSNDKLHFRLLLSPSLEALLRVVSIG